jgi:chloramphenicol-sensitive protein RarD
VNWFVYVWAVVHHFIIETSLGYFITPLVNVLLGVVLLRERLATVSSGLRFALARGWRWLPRVRSMATCHGSRSRLAVTFGTYGLVKKKAPLGSVPGLTLETVCCFCRRWRSSP